MEFDWSASRGTEAGIYRGLDAVMGFFATYFDVFAEITVEPECFIDAGESVVVPNGSRSQGRDGIEVYARGVAFVLTVRNRRITRFCLYQDKDDALKAVGLEEYGRGAQRFRELCSPRLFLNGSSACSFVPALRIPR